MGDVTETFLRTAKRRRSARMPTVVSSNRVVTGPTNVGRRRGMEAAQCNRPIAPGNSAKSSAPLGQRHFRELFLFLSALFAPDAPGQWSRSSTITSPHIHPFPPHYRSRESPMNRIVPLAF